MSYRKLRGDNKSSYEDVEAQLREGDAQLVAVWLSDPFLVYRVSGIADASHFDRIVQEDPPYIMLEFFASTEIREEHRYGDIYPDAPSYLDLTFMDRTISMQPFSHIAPLLHGGSASMLRLAERESGWGEPFELTLTEEWQEVAPGIQAKMLTRVLVFRRWNSEAGQWGEDQEDLASMKWWEFTPGVQVRKSPDNPNKTQFRLNL